jgi:alpha-tubulin suppressor-like RCC1 family protein
MIPKQSRSTALIVFIAMLSFVLWATPALAQSATADATPTPAVATADAIVADDYIKVVVGESHSCALTATGAVKCWGANEFGQLGDGSHLNRSAAATVIDLDVEVADLVASDKGACVLSMDGEVWCWGVNFVSNRPQELTQVEDLPGVATAIAGGNSHRCAVVDGDVYCWGNNFGGQLGGGDKEYADGIVQVEGLAERAVDVAAGWRHTCASLESGVVQCWGENDLGQLGDGSGQNSLTPVTVAGLDEPVQQLDGAGGKTCALLESGTVACWGTAEMTARSVSGFGGEVTNVSVGGFDNACAIADGAVYCWGENIFGRDGSGVTNNQTRPTSLVELPENAVSVDVNSNHACAVTEAGQVYCWGFNGSGQMGDGAVMQRPIPIAPTGVVSVTDLAVGGARHVAATTCAILPPANGVVCWGGNDEGQLGNGTESTYSASPVKVKGLDSGFAQVVVGQNHACARNEAGAVYCWGGNNSGQLGYGSHESSSAPVRVTGLEDGVTKLVAGAFYTCGLLESSAVQCWGSHVPGFLGDQAVEFAFSPVVPEGLDADVVDIAGGDSHVCALMAAGEVMCWGGDFAGQLGTGETGGEELTPVAATVLSESPLSLALGNSYSCALMADNQVMCWGNNPFGQLGTGADGFRSTEPVAVEGLPEQIVGMDAAGDTSCVVTEAGAVYCWGSNTFGNLGSGVAEISDPLPGPVVGLAGKVRQVDVGGVHTCVVLEDGRPLCWGSDSYSQLGAGASPMALTPVLVTDTPTSDVRVAADKAMPGSVVTVRGFNLPAGATITVAANDEVLTDTLHAGEAGAFAIYLDTADAEPGYYALVIESGAGLTGTTAFSLTAHLVLTDSAPLVEQEGAGLATVALPAGSALDLLDAPAELQRRTYLTLNAGVNVRSTPNGELVAKTNAVTEVVYDAARTLENAVEATFTDADGVAVVLQGVNAANRVWLPVLWEDEPAWVADVVVAGVAVR